MVIWKFPIERGELGRRLPRGAKIISAGVQDGWRITIWALVDPEAPLVERLIEVVGTGSSPALSDGIFIGTVFVGLYVFHVFDGGER